MWTRVPESPAMLMCSEQWQWRTEASACYFGVLAQGPTTQGPRGARGHTPRPCASR
jgi:hypothetical protein